PRSTTISSFWAGRRRRSSCASGSPPRLRARSASRSISRALGPDLRHRSPERGRPALPPGPYLVVGLARSGVAASLALRAAIPDAAITACDAGSPDEAERARERLAKAGVEVHLNTDGTQLLAASKAPRTLVKSPGVPAGAPVVSGARARA